MAKILLIGDYGREHALAWKLAQSTRVEKIFVAPGNAGTQGVAENVPIAITDGEALADFAEKNKIDFTIGSMDDTFAAGVVDTFKMRGLKIFGPTKAAAEIEWSKAVAKRLMQEAGIPTAAFQTFTEHSVALAYLHECGVPIVLKASGLARGKGVYVCHTMLEAEEALSTLMLSDAHGGAGNEVVIEEFLMGQEISIHALCDGKNFLLFPPSQDHKPIGEGDTGPNTGGIGAIAPVPWVSAADMEVIRERIVGPILAALAKEGRPFVGCLYPGLMMTPQGPKVVEFNARFGDPECEAYMRLLTTDALEMLEACVDGTLDALRLEWSGGFVASVFLVSDGYPNSYATGLPISGIAEAEKIPGVVVFHAGTKMEDGVLKTNGGRVLNVTALGSTLQEALDRAYMAAEKIDFDGVYYRRDIGKKSLPLG